MILRRVQLADGRTRAFINDQAISVQTLKAVGSALVESTASMTSARWSMPPRIAACSMRSPGWKRTSPRWSSCGRRGAPPRRARRAPRRHGARRARGGLSAACLRRTEKARAKGRRGDRAGGTPHHHDAGREDRQRSARGAGSGRRQSFAGTGAVRRGAPPGTPRRQFAGAGRARGEGDRCRDQRAGRGRPASQRRAESPPISIRPSWSASRSGCSRCAPPRENIRRRSMGSAALATQYAVRRRADRCRRRTVEEAGSRRRRGRQALWRRRRQAFGRAGKGRGKARQGRQCRAAAAQTRARQLHHAIGSRCGIAGPAGHRPHRVLGADQSGHAAGAADEGRFRRRAVALSAGAEGGARRPRLGADPGVRRNRHRRRRRGGRRHRHPAGAPRRQGTGDGGDACAAGRRPRRHAFADFQGRARQGQARRHPRQRARRRPPPRGNRPHAGRRRDHRGGEGRGGAAAPAAAV